MADERIYTPEKGELQLTVRAVVSGCILGALVAGMNIFFGLKTGWGIGGSLIAAILAYAFFAMIRPRNAFTPLETNISQTVGSAAGSMTSAAGLVACIPALSLLGRDLGWLELYLWAASVAYLGVFFAVPLRRQMVLVEKLRFPTGTATANTIVAMFGSGEETVRRARALVGVGAFAFCYTLVMFFFPYFEEVPLADWIPIAAVGVAATYGFSLYISPLLIGAGILVGMRVTLSLVAGAIVGWAVLAPLVGHWGWVDDPNAVFSYKTGARGWILWPGVAIMFGDAMTNLLLSWRTILNTFRRQTTADGEALEDPREAIPNAWWLGGLAVSTVLIVVTMHFLFGIPFYLTIFAIALSSVLAAIATRSTGETDINPIGGVGKVTQLVYGGIARGAMETNLLAAGITGAGASQAADMMQDLKTGHLLGASPRKQFRAQLWGIAAGIVVCVPIYFLVTNAWEIGSKKLPAPAAYAWHAMAEVLAKGMGALPPNAKWGALAGLLVGLSIPLLGRLQPKWKKWLPSGLAFGIAFLVFPFQSLCFLIGAVAYAIWKARNRSNAESLGFAVASGLIAGEGLGSLVQAAFKFLGWSAIYPPPGA